MNNSNSGAALAGIGMILLMCSIFLFMATETFTTSRLVDLGDRYKTLKTTHILYPYTTIGIIVAMSGLVLLIVGIVIGLQKENHKT